MAFLLLIPAGIAFLFGAILAVVSRRTKVFSVAKCLPLCLNPLLALQTDFTTHKSNFDNKIVLLLYIIFGLSACGSLYLIAQRILHGACLFKDTSSLMVILTYNTSYLLIDLHVSE